MGGAVIAIYTVAGGMQAIVWAQFIQTFLLWFGAILCMITVLHGIDGGISTVISTGIADGKFLFGDLNKATGQIEPAPWFSLQNKAVIMMLIGGLMGWMGEYSSNQNVIQKYCAAKNPREATKSIWICCLCSVPTWAFFMFLGTCLYVYYQQHIDPVAQDILTGANNAKAESILPHFLVSSLPTGVAGLVITGVLAAAMSASSSSVNSISAISVTDIYRRHIAKNHTEGHYVVVARIISAASCVIMMGGAVLFLQLSKLTLQDTGTKLGAILGGGLFGLYMLGFITRRGTGRSVAIAILATILFSAYIAMIEMGWITTESVMTYCHIPHSIADRIAHPVHTYYAGIFGNIIMFVVAYAISSLFERRPRDLTNLTVWTQKSAPAEE
jgi:SSS family solute:Na+ symporter